MDTSMKVSVQVDTYNFTDLPHFQDGTKSLRCTAGTTIIKLIDYINNSLNFQRHILCDPSTFSASNYVEMVLETKTTNELGEREVIVLDN